ncbi:signal peptidase I [Virgibacillus soli]|uniref:Signal peptidase I n=1 Tax=Paracerasibacillus soli TaxID=480284 RepID=A0ABU5CP73_9BACI|nr:signal peptidase I [Virgibacillus soli]MDY0408144.1 signal peptidase I [Virgibacillus soli]
MNKQKNGWLDWIKALLIALGLAFIVRTFFFTPIIVDGPSMLPTLHDRDQMIVNKFSYRISEPKRFDIVVFHASEQKDFIKRVIGLPGEHIAFKDDVLYVNGKEIDEDFLHSNSVLQPFTEDFTLEELPGNFETVPDDYYLVLGDNRENSVDSRSLGLIPKEQIVGKTSIIYWPMNRMKVLGE